MKKILLGVVIAGMAATVNASYLYWQVDSSAYDNTVNAAKVTIYNNGAQTALATVYNESGNYWSVPQSNGAWADIGSYTGESYSYFVELGNYANSTFETKYKSSELTYNTYAGSLIVDSTLSREIAAASKWAASNITYNAVPEPTSGLLTLIGMALLGLRRKRA